MYSYNKWTRADDLQTKLWNDTTGRIHIKVLTTLLMTISSFLYQLMSPDLSFWMFNYCPRKPLNLSGNVVSTLT